MGSCFSKKGVVAPNKVVPEFDEKKDYLGEHGYSHVVKSKEGVDLFAYFWPADPGVPLKGIIQLAHGSAAYTCFDYLKFKGPGQPNVYEGSWVAAFNRAGFAVCGLDAQGSGRSKAGRPSPKSFDSHVDNLFSLAEHVSEHGGPNFPKNLPYFLVGHCLGGLAATVACVRQPGRFAGLVLLSPLMSAERSKGAATAKPSAKETPKADGDPTASSEPAVPPWISEAWVADPYASGAGGQHAQLSTAKPAVEQLCSAGVMEGISLPLLIFQSERDTYSDPEAARKLHDRAGSPDKTFRLLSIQWHLLTKEPGWEELLAETTAWLAARATNSGALTRGLGGTVLPTPGPAGDALAAAAAGNPAPAAADAAAAAGAAGLTLGQGGALPPSQTPPLTRSMSMLERLPEHEPLVPRSPDKISGPGAGGSSGGAAGGSQLPVRRYSFSGPRPATAGPLLGPLPPLGQRRSLGTLPPELAGYQLRGRLPPLPPLPPLMDRKPIA